MKKTEWFLVANATHARLLSLAEDGPLQLVSTFDHPASRKKTSELGDDRASPAFEPRADDHRKEHLHFAHELALFLEHQARVNSFGALTLFAPNPFLGEVKAALGSVSRARLTDTHDVDLSHVGLAEMHKRIQVALAH